MQRDPEEATAALKAKVDVEALKDGQTLVKLAERFQVYPNQITEWRKHILIQHPLCGH